MMEKVEVNGTGAHPAYQYLKTVNGNADITWNFAKFLVDKDGKVIKDYGPKCHPDEIVPDIEEQLAK